MLLQMYERLLGYMGPQRWWPVSHGFRPPEWEIMVGAVLTQNTNWDNVEKALTNIERAGIKDRESLLSLSNQELAELIRPSGYYNQKARKLKGLAGFSGELNRKNLLSLWGIGPETADSILLYTMNKAFFVIDAYTLRIFSRLELMEKGSSYEKAREFFENRLPRDPRLYREFHALLVEMGKRFCRPRPLCGECPMSEFCRYEGRTDRV